MNHLILDCFCFLFLCHRQGERGRDLNFSAHRFEIGANNCRVSRCYLAYSSLVGGNFLVGGNDVDVFRVGLLHGVASVTLALSALAILTSKTADDNAAEQNE